MMEMFYNAWEETCSDGHNEQTFKSNMMTLVFDGRENDLASKKLINLVGEEMLIFTMQIFSYQSLEPMLLSRSFAQK